MVGFASGDGSSDRDHGGVSRLWRHCRKENKERMLMAMGAMEEVGHEGVKEELGQRSSREGMGPVLEVHPRVGRLLGGGCACRG